MENFIVGGILVVVIGLSVFFIIREKKKGKRCIGCPSGGSCGKSGKSCCCESKENR